MKKLTLSVAVVLGVAAFSSCKKESASTVAPLKAVTVSDKGNLGNGDFSGDSTATTFSTASSFAAPSTAAKTTSPSKVKKSK